MMNKIETITVIKNKGKTSEKSKKVKAKHMAATDNWIVSTGEIDVRDGDIIILPSGEKGKATKIFRMDMEDHVFGEPIQIRFTFEPILQNRD